MVPLVNKSKIVNFSAHFLLSFNAFTSMGLFYVGKSPGVGTVSLPSFFVSVIFFFAINQELF